MKKYILILATLTMAVLSASSCGERWDDDDYPELPTKYDSFVNTGNYTITDGYISEEVLKNYLSRSITEAEYLSSGTDDDERMLINVGAKFIGRAMYTWGGENKFLNESWFTTAKTKADKLHAKDPDIILQAAMFEIVTSKVNDIPIPAWVFQAFGKTPESRNFNMEKMANPGGAKMDYWDNNGHNCVPDMTQEEAQMWFYYMGVRYMEVGCEALHSGQVNLMSSMGDKAAKYDGFRKVYGLLREAAKTKARRGFVLIDAHTAGIQVDGVSLTDYGAFPLRLREKTSSKTYEAELRRGYLDSIIGKTPATKSPFGWSTKRLPYILEFDNFGVSSHPTQANLSDNFVWGWDEISWLSKLSDEDGQKFVRYAVDWMNNNDPMGFIEMPGCRGAVSAAHSPYRCNTQSANCQYGRNLEETIKELWK